MSIMLAQALFSSALISLSLSHIHTHTHSLITSIFALTTYNPVAGSAASYWVISIIITCWDLWNEHVILSKSVVTLPHLQDSSSVTLKLPPICSLNSTNCISRRSSHPPIDEIAQQIAKALSYLLALSPDFSSSAQHLNKLCTIYIQQSESLNNQCLLVNASGHRDILVMQYLDFMVEKWHWFPQLIPALFN